MTDKTLAVIPARGGSKRLKGKNLKKFCGKPLISWSIELALDTAEIDKVVISSEDENILNYSRKYKDCYVISRPDSLSNDDTSGYEVVKYLAKAFKDYNNIILLQPTSPLRAKDDIIKAITLLEKQETAVISVCKVLHVSSLATLASPGKKFIPINNRKDNIYIPNGAIYAAKSEWILKNKSFYEKDVVIFEMPGDRSIDIDYEYQFAMAEAVHKKTIKYNHVK